jgi:hypothetical protein
MWNKCDKCVSDKSLCSHCRDNPEVQKILASLPKLSFFMNYAPVCPRGYLDCVYDPAYIHFHYPDWYKELYGDKTPEEAAEKCRQKMLEDPDEENYCYDDEDK